MIPRLPSSPLFPYTTLFRSLLLASAAVTGAGLAGCTRASPHQAGEPTGGSGPASSAPAPRSEEHTSELQSLRHLVCRLLLEKKKTGTKQLAPRPRKRQLKQS